MFMLFTNSSRGITSNINLKAHINAHTHQCRGTQWEWEQYLLELLLFVKAYGFGRVWDLILVVLANVESSLVHLHCALQISPPHPVHVPAAEEVSVCKDFPHSLPRSHLGNKPHITRHRVLEEHNNRGTNLKLLKREKELYIFCFL